MRTFLFILLAITFSNCEETYSFENESSFEPTLVVEGVITSENKRHEIKLSQTFLNLDDVPPVVEDAIVALFDNSDQPALLTQDPNRPGTYLTDTLRALFGKVYGLYILHEGREYYAFATPDVGSPVEELVLETRDDGWYEYLYQESTTPSMMEVEITWQELNEENELVERKNTSYHYTLDVIDVNKIFRPEKEKILFPKGAQIVRRKYSLGKEHQEFLRSYLSEVDWRGNIFDVAAGNVNTNIEGGAFGYFWASIVRVDIQTVN